jgi:hypothetical protein
VSKRVTNTCVNNLDSFATRQILIPFLDSLTGHHSNLPSVILVVILVYHYQYITHNKYCNLVIMKSTIISILLACLCLFAGTTNGFTTPTSVSARISTSPLSTTTTTTTRLNVFGNRKSQAQKSAPEDDKYWQGEWVCKDCGYIYNRVSRTISPDTYILTWIFVEMSESDIVCVVVKLL